MSRALSRSTGFAFTLAALALLLLALVLSLGSAQAQVDPEIVINPKAPTVCSAEINGDNVTDYESADASAVRDAVNAVSAGALIKLAGTCRGTDLIGGEHTTVYISKSLTLQGGYLAGNWLVEPRPDILTTTLTAESTGRVVYIRGIVDVTLDSLYMAEGRIPKAGHGGAIYNSGRLTVTNSIVSDSHAPDGSGGGIANLYELYLGASRVRNNRATLGVGGGIANGSIASQSQAAGTPNALGPVTVIEDSTIDNNIAFTGRGGGLANVGGLVTIINSTFSQNDTPDDGGAIYQTDSGSVNLRHSTVVSNLLISVLNGEPAATSRYAILADGGTVRFANTIVANTRTNVKNCWTGPGPIGGTFATDGHNLEDADTCSLTGTGDVKNTHPKTKPLGAYGGPTPVHALEVGSPAIDVVPAGANGCGATILTDQRGVARPIGTKCDKGAVEYKTRCFAEIDGDNATDYQSEDASAARMGIDNVSTGGKVRLAGYCSGVTYADETWRTVFITRGMTVEGAYDPTDWNAGSQPGVYTTTLDALRQGGVAYVSATLPVTLSHMTLTGGQDQGAGGVYQQTGSLAMDGLYVVDNLATKSGGGVYVHSGDASIKDTIVEANGSGSFGGGAILVSGTLALEDSRVVDNWALFGGGGIAHVDGSLRLDRTDVSGNRCTNSAGGGFFSDAGDLNVYDSDIVGNEAKGDGGGLYSTGSNVTLDGTSLTSNESGQVGGGIFSTQRAIVVDSTIAGNWAKEEGGGIWASIATLDISHSTLNNNRSGEGGGIMHYEGRLTLHNSTLSGNTALSATTGYAGGAVVGISNFMTVTHSTIVSNSSPALPGHEGIVLTSGAKITLGNSILAYNGASGAGNCVPGDGPIVDTGHNIENADTCALTAGTSLKSTHPDLYPLDDNGGPTWTHAPRPGSPAINHITNLAKCAVDDQRGEPRPGGAGCEPGSYEAQDQILDVYLAGSGSGGVTSTPAGIDCQSGGASDCSETYAYGTEVTLSASPIAPSTFGGWSGACTNNSSDCSLTLTASKQVTATFDIDVFLVYLPLVLRGE